MTELRSTRRRIASRDLGNGSTLYAVPADRIVDVIAKMLRHRRLQHGLQSCFVRPPNRPPGRPNSPPQPEPGPRALPRTPRSEPAPQRGCRACWQHAFGLRERESRQHSKYVSKVSRAIGSILAAARWPSGAHEGGAMPPIGIASASTPCAAASPFATPAGWHGYERRCSRTRRSPCMWTYDLRRRMVTSRANWAVGQASPCRGPCR